MNLLDYEPPRRKWTWDFTWFAIVAAVCLGVFLIGTATLAYRTLNTPTTTPVRPPMTAGG